MDSSQDEKANNDLQEFMRKKIRSTVKDPTVAEKLCLRMFPWDSETRDRMQVKCRKN